MDFQVGIVLELVVDVDDVQLPSMILQPIVENAVNHGIRDVEWAGHIQLIVQHISEGLVISVKDNGQGMTQERIREILEGRVHENEEQKDSTGIGMDNVINRLELFFGIKGLLQIYSGGIGKGTEVRIMIPEKALAMQQQAKEAQEREKMQGQDGVFQ